MARFKVVTVEGVKEGIRMHERWQVWINVDGEFYCNIPQPFRSAAEGVPGSHSTARNGLFQVREKSFDRLQRRLWDIMQAHLNPEVKTETVILFNIRTEVSFAIDEAGEIVPNASYPGAKWRERDGRYGNLDACNSGRGGYSMVIGAKAYTKKTVTWGERKEVTYKLFHGEGNSHHNKDHPAARLNSWCSQGVGMAREIPYTDAAAIFFDKMLMGMARIARAIQESTFDTDDLLELIETGGNPLRLESK